MRILIEAHHPGDIHFWKYPVRELIHRGHDVHMVGRDRDVMRQLLEAYSWIPHEIPKRPSAKNRFPLKEMLSRQLTVMRAIHRFRPDVVASLFGSYCQSAHLMGCPNIIFTDSEFQHFNHRIAHPFADVVYTPECFWKDLGAKQRRYRGYHELAFLAQKYFRPRSKVLERLGCAEQEYIIFRLSAWNTFHDIGQSGFGEQAVEFVEKWKARYRVFIVAEEGKCDPRLAEHRFELPPDWFHDAMYYSRLVMTEGASTASEAACMGVPTVYVNSTEHRGYLDELRDNFGLVATFPDSTSGIRQAEIWLNESAARQKAEFNHRVSAMQSHNIDVVQFVVREVEHHASNRRND